MTRPFSQTMQAYRLDLHPLWIGLLATSILMSLAWIGWAATERVAVHETSSRVALTQPAGKSPGNKSARRRTNADDATPQRWLEARFPASARESLKPGQEAVVFIKSDAGEQPIPAVITEVSDSSEEDLRVVLRANVQNGASDPFERATPSRVRVPAGTRTPLDLWLPELARRARPKAPLSPRTPQ